MGSRDWEIGEVKEEGVKSGYKTKQKWYTQFLGDTMNTKLFANKINEFFVSLADRFTPLTRDSPPSLVLQELFVFNEEVFWSLSDIHNFSMDHNMILNSIKCKEMLINLMWYPNFTLEPLVVGNNAIECVSIYKILGVFIDSNVKWNSHVDYIYKKLARSSTPYVFYVEPALIKEAC